MSADQGPPVRLLNQPHPPGAVGHRARTSLPGTRIPTRSPNVKQRT
jgi:hypothetical protein